MMRKPLGKALSALKIFSTSVENFFVFFLVSYDKGFVDKLLKILKFA